MWDNHKILRSFRSLILILLLEKAIVVSAGNIPKVSTMDSFAIVTYSNVSSKRMVRVPRSNDGLRVGGEILKLSEMMSFRGGSSTSSSTSSSSNSIHNKYNKRKDKNRGKDGDPNVLTSQTPSQEGEEQPIVTVTRKKGQARRTSTRQSPTKRTKTVTKVRNQEAATILRLKREYKDVIQMGIAYDWIRMQSIHMTTRRDRNSSNHPTYDRSSEYDQRSVTTTNSSTCFIRLGPLGQNLLLWHFSIQGPPDSAYAEGMYHGRIILPRDYPSSPPRIQLITPNGRFIPRVDICLSASSYHPETWTPQWTILALIQSLRLHFLTDPNEIGGIAFCTVADKKRLATKSRSWRWRIPTSNVLIDHSAMIAQFQNERSEKRIEKHFMNKYNLSNDTSSICSEEDISELTEDGITATISKTKPNSRILAWTQPKNPQQAQLTKSTNLDPMKKRYHLLTEVFFRVSFLIGFLLAMVLF